MLSHFPSPNPQEVAFALKELALDREIVPVDLARGGHRQPRFLARNPLGRVPALVGGELTLPGIACDPRLSRREDWPAVSRHRRPGAVQALRWLFFLSRHIMPSGGEVALRFRAKLFGRPVD